MAPQKENKIMHWLQTVLLGVITAAIYWVGGTLVDLKVIVSNQETKQVQIIKDGTEMKADIDELQKSKNNHEGRLIMIETSFKKP